MCIDIYNKTGQEIEMNVPIDLVDGPTVEFVDNETIMREIEKRGLVVVDVIEIPNEDKVRGIEFVGRRNQVYRDGELIWDYIIEKKTIRMLKVKIKK